MSLESNTNVRGAIPVLEQAQRTIATSGDRLQPGAFARHLSRLMLKLINQGQLAPGPHLLFPKFAPGGTVKALTGNRARVSGQK